MPQINSKKLRVNYYYQNGITIFIMKKYILLMYVGVLLLTVGAFAQKNIDSLSSISKISDYKLKLAKLENNVDGSIKDKKDAEEKAQISANANIVAANNLSDHPEDKKLAKDASNKANDAKSDSRKGRKESDKLDKLRKDIREMKGKIANEQAKLDRYTQASTTSSPIPLIPVDTDTTRHNQL
jgi:hypothetical protein